LNGKPYVVGENSERNWMLAQRSSVVSFFVLAILFKTDPFLLKMDLTADEMSAGLFLT